MRKLAAPLAILIASFVILSCASSGDDDPNKTKTDAFSDYTRWAKVNSETITGAEGGPLGSAHEGAAGYREVFINSVGEDVSNGEAAVPYPFGTIIVKESYKASGGQKGDMTAITVMVKREDDFDAENGNWEYIMLTPAMKVQGQGKLAACNSCHDAADEDWVFTDNR